eukprot:TRINITY_DN21233_c0_g4_i2.p1 TRINITY_DN21233_c0_g4~~TRINITY_DN21233_c0_g4_i2.p1  ORF type:complete len:407 (+),score=99.42 TRINITY_DN21233_c0_g4_i2:87-1307(+)
MAKRESGDCGAAEWPLTLEAIRALPKVELHAHLSGCITQPKLIELLAKRGNGETFTPFDCRADVSNALAKCFDYFAKVAAVVSDLDALMESTIHVLETFAAENCLYFEMRTSPKQFRQSPAVVNGNAAKEALTTKMQYLQTIREAIAKFQSTAQERYGYIMEVKILLSIDRGKITSKESALEQIDDVLQMQREHPDLVVGIDVCGNPSKPTVVPYLIPALLDRKEAFQQLPITFHTAEIRDDEESYLIIDNIRQLNIRRLGHVCFLPDECRKKLLSSSLHEDGGSIGIELCPTSNQITRELDDLGGHHFLEWWRQSEHILLSINTDDTGLFSCDLSSEVYDLAKAFKLTKTDIVDIQRQALRSSFHPEKERLLRNFEERLSLANKLAALNTCEASCLENDAKRLKA